MTSDERGVSRCLTHSSYSSFNEHSTSFTFSCFPPVYLFFSLSLCFFRRQSERTVFIQFIITHYRRTLIDHRPTIYSAQCSSQTRTAIVHTSSCQIAISSTHVFDWPSTSPLVHWISTHLFLEFSFSKLHVGHCWITDVKACDKRASQLCDEQCVSRCSVM